MIRSGRTAVAATTLALGVALLLEPAASACTNFLITPGASADRSAMITYTADSHTLYGELRFIPAADHLPGEMVDVHDAETGKLLGKIKQAAHTYAVVGDMNEHQVAIGETTFGGRGELQDPTAAIDYGSLMLLGIQRGRTAREAIEAMGALVAEYGYASEGETFSVSDSNEVWIMEIIGKGPGRTGALWVARRVPDGYVTAHANQSRIRQFPLDDPQNCLYTKDVISFAREKGWFKGRDEEFSFADAYAPLTFGALRFCEGRVWCMFHRVAPSLGISADWIKGVEGAEPLPLWIKPDRKLAVHDLMELMRDHFEGTEFDLSKGIGAGPFSLPYRWRPLTWEVDGVKYLNERAVSTQQTGYSFVAQSRAGVPDPVGGVLWFGVDDTSSTVYVPIYCGVRRPPPSFAGGVATLQKFSWDSAFWVFNFVSNFSYLRYSDMIADVREVQRRFEGEFLARQAEIETAALEVYAKSPEAARDYLTDYSVRQGERVVARWKTLLEDLLVRYMDGNVKDELGAVQHPPYPEEWYRAIAKADDGRLRMKKLPGEPVIEKVVSGGGFFHSRDELGALAEKVPADFPFDREKLFLVTGSDRCNRPPECCAVPRVEASSGKLVLELPAPKPDTCGAPAWLVRVPGDEKRPVITQQDAD
jgi:dipeptidase